MKLDTKSPERRISGRHWVLGALANMAVTRPKFVVLGALFVTIVAVVLLIVPGVRIVTDRAALVSSDDPTQQRYREVSEMFGSVSLAIIVLEGDERTPLRAAADEINEALEDNGHVRSVFYRLDMGFFHDRALLYLTDEQFECVDFAMGPSGLGGAAPEGEPGLVGLINGVRSKIETASPDTEIPEQCKGVNPLVMMNRLFSEIGEWVDDPGRDRLEILREGDLPEGGPSAGQYGVDDQGYLVESDQESPHLLFMIVQPESTSGDEEVARALVNSLRSVARSAAERHGVHAGVTGMPAIVTDEMDAVREDVKTTIVTAIFFVLLLFVVTFRSLRAMALVSMPLVLGLLWTAGFAAAVYSNLTVVSVYFAAVLFGLGIAFGIHLLSRFEEGRREGKDAAEAVRYAMEGAGPGIITGGVTTSAAFLAVGFVEFKGFAQLGVVAGAGVLLMLIGSLTVMPATLVLWKGKPLPEPKGRAWLGVFGDFLTRRSWAVLVVAAILAAAGAYGSTRILFNYDFTDLLPSEAEALRSYIVLADRSEFSADVAIAVASSPEEAESLRQRFESLDTVSRAEAVTKYLPGTEAEQRGRVKNIKGLAKTALEPITKVRDQAKAALVPGRRVEPEAVASALEELADTTEDAWFAAQQTGRGEAPDLQQLTKTLRDTAIKVRGAVPSSASKRLLALERIMSEGVVGGTEVLLKNLTEPDVLRPEDLPASVRERFLSKNREGRALYAVYAYPTGRVGNREFLVRFHEELMSANPETTGFPITHYFHGEMARKAFFQAAAYAALATLLLLAIDFRRLRDVVFAAIPLGIGAAFMLGTMALLEWSYNFVNVVALPLVFGAGVDFGVHLVHRFRQEGSAAAALRTTGRPVILSAVTTLVGMGGLAMAHHRGAASLGWLMVIGIGYCLLSAAVVLPAAMTRWPRRGEKS